MAEHPVLMELIVCAVPNCAPAVVHWDQIFLVATLVAAMEEEMADKASTVSIIFGEGVRAL